MVLLIGKIPLPVFIRRSAPVYGDFFEGNDVATKAETGQPIMTSQPIVDLLAYLQGLQQ